METPINSQPAEATGVPPPAPGSVVRVKLRFRAVEYHEIIREVAAEKIDSMENDGELFDWLHQHFVDDSMPDSDINTESFGLDHFETLPDSQNDRGETRRPEGPELAPSLC